jgi:hypothetical protein
MTIFPFLKKLLFFILILSISTKEIYAKPQADDFYLQEKVKKNKVNVAQKIKKKLPLPWYSKCASLVKENPVLTIVTIGLVVHTAVIIYLLATRKNVSQQVTQAIAAQNIPQQVTQAITAQNIHQQVTQAITAQNIQAITAQNIHQQVTQAITAQNIPDKVTQAVAAENIPDKVTQAVAAENIPDKVTQVITAENIPDKITQAITDEDIPDKVTELVKKSIENIVRSIIKADPLIQVHLKDIVASTLSKRRGSLG